MQQFSMLIQSLIVGVSAPCLSQQQVDEAMLESSKQAIEVDVQKVEQSPIMFCLLAYQFLAREDWNTLFKLLSKTKQPE